MLSTQIFSTPCSLTYLHLSLSYFSWTASCWPTETVFKPLKVSHWWQSKHWKTDEEMHQVWLIIMNLLTEEVSFLIAGVMPLSKEYSFCTVIEKWLLAMLMVCLKSYVLTPKFLIWKKCILTFLCFFSLSFCVILHMWTTWINSTVFACGALSWMLICTVFHFIKMFSAFY